MRQKKKWDLIVVGGGHAGCEAAHAAASMGCDTLLLTMQKDAIGKMSCNPAIGGVGKGHLVKEIDALGGVMGFIADETAIQFRKLNTKKGVAVQATRCQSDMRLYNQKMIEVIKNCPNLFVKEGEVISFVFQNNKIQGVKTSAGESLLSKAVVLTGGTFLRGKIYRRHLLIVEAHIGLTSCSLNGNSFFGVEFSKLDCSFICNKAHNST